jgi:long-chain acyl-CoA synthetase
MGGTQSKVQYSAPISEPKKGETAVYRHTEHKEALVTIPKNKATTIQEVLLSSFKLYAHENYLGVRAVVSSTTDPKTGRNVNVLKDSYDFLTYQEVEKRARALGAAILAKDLSPVKSQFRKYNLRFAAIYGKNMLEWILTDIACNLYGITTVPVYDTLGDEAVEFMFKETELTTLFLSADHVKKIAAKIKNGAFKFLKNLVILDEINLMPEDEKNLEGVNWFKFNDLLKSGESLLPKELPKVTPDDISFFSYTSGTTGNPKGAMASHRNAAALVAGCEVSLSFLDHNSVHISYLPLAHVLEKIVHMFITHLGAKYCFFGGDVNKLKDDLLIAKPTFFVSVPRLFNKFHDTLKSKIGELTGCKGTLANKALRVKLENVENGHYTHFLYDKLVFNKMKAVLGGRCELLLTGSAPLSTPVKKFLKVAFSCPFLEGYGQTEALGAEFLTRTNCPEFGIVGGPVPQNEFKLVDVPEMNYFSTDKDEQGNLCPRGEIWVRGANVIPGYYKNEEKNAETFTSDGWLQSGDVGMITPNGALKIIDRRKNIFKLSHGEYVAPDRLEQVYKTTTGIADIFVYGDSLKSVLIAIINLSPDFLKVAKDNGVEGDSLEALCKSDKANKLVLDTLKKTCEVNGLKGFERISKVHLEPRPFADLDLLTTTFKLKRNETKAAFKDVIAKLYVGLE